MVILTALRSGQVTAPAVQQGQSNVTDTPMVTFCGQDWWYHSRAHSDVQLMLCLARDRRVLMVNSIGMRMPMPGRSQRFLRKILKKLGSLARFIRRPVPELPNLFVMTPLSIPVYHIPALRGLAAFLVRCQVRTVAWWLGIRNPIVFITVPTAWEVVQGMRRSALIYNRSDRHSAFAEANQGYIRAVERDLMRGADHVLYVNRQLMASESEFCGQRAYFLDHGVDLERFQLDGAVADELEGIPRPRVGFVGGLRSHLVDLELLERIATEVPECQLVLVGDAPSDIGRLVRHSNVHWLGPKDPAEVPRYGRGLDVALMPYLVNDWIRACNPIKLKEYLALGLAVVSTDFPAARQYLEAIRIAPDRDQFVALVREAVRKTRDEDRPARYARRQLIEGDSWEQKASEVIALCAGRPGTLG